MMPTPLVPTVGDLGFRQGCLCEASRGPVNSARTLVAKLSLPELPLKNRPRRPAIVVVIGVRIMLALPYVTRPPVKRLATGVGDVGGANGWGISWTVALRLTRAPPMTLVRSGVLLVKVYRFALWLWIVGWIMPSS